MSKSVHNEIRFNVSGPFERGDEYGEKAMKGDEESPSLLPESQSTNKKIMTK